MRVATDNTLLLIAGRPSRARRSVECAAWMVAYGVAIAALWYGSLLAGPYLRSFG